LTNPYNPGSNTCDYEYMGFQIHDIAHGHETGLGRPPRGLDTALVFDLGWGVDRWWPEGEAI